MHAPPATRDLMIRLTQPILPILRFGDENMYNAYEQPRVLFSIIWTASVTGSDAQIVILSY